MIACLRGRVLERQPTRLVVEVGGVGFDVHVPLTTGQAAGEAGSEVSLYTVLVVREDSLTLYGFAERADRALFQKLTGVSGIGPKLALNALSGAGASELVRALQERDLAFLTRLPGIGKKTAERMSLELKDALAEFVGAAPASTRGQAEADAVEALVSLGYKRPVASDAVGRARSADTKADVEALIRMALSSLSGAGK